MPADPADPAEGSGAPADPADPAEGSGAPGGGRPAAKWTVSSVDPLDRPEARVGGSEAMHDGTTGDGTTGDDVLLIGNNGVETDGAVAAKGWTASLSQGFVSSSEALGRREGSLRSNPATASRPADETNLQGG